MALKQVLTSKTEFDALPEAVRSEYTAREDKWYLNVEGMVTKTEHDEMKVKLAEFRDNNRALHNEVEELKPLKIKLKDIRDVDAFLAEHATLKSQVEEFKRKGITDVSGLQAAIDAAMKPVNEKLEAAEKARIKAEEASNDARFRELITADATKAGVRPTSVRHVLREAADKFEYKNGVIVAKAGVKHPTEPLKDYTPTDWLGDLAKSDENLFGESTGGGANGDRRPPPPANVKQLINPSPEEMGKHMDDIAAGKAVVIRQ